MTIRHRRIRGLRVPIGFAVLLFLLMLLAAPAALRGQSTLVGDLTHVDADVPVRLMGYGLVVGLDGTGDRFLGGRTGGGVTVQSVANLLRRFDIEVPESMLRTRNVAAVLVTAETSPWLRPGGRFSVQVSSLGDATSLRGGVLWMTPLVADPRGEPFAAAQGPLAIAGNSDSRAIGRYRGETSARIPDGGVMEVDIAPMGGTELTRLLLRRPDLGTAERIALVVNEAFGPGTATVDDPGSVRIETDPGGPTLWEIQSLEVDAMRRPRILVDARDGTVVAGGGIRIGEAVVNHGGITLTISDQVEPNTDDDWPTAGELRMTDGASAQDVASALHAVGASAREIAAILQGLRDIGALSAEVVVR